MTADEKRALQPSGALLERVQMGSFPLANVTKLSVLPALYVANGTESVEAPTSDPRVGESTLQEVYELFPIVLRVGGASGS